MDFVVDHLRPLLKGLKLDFVSLAKCLFFRFNQVYFGFGFGKWDSSLMAKFKQVLV
jgi:hypothetical protein